MSWSRCSSGTPCKICGATRWCGYTDQGRVCCMAEAKGRTEDMDTTGFRRLRVDGNGGVHYWPADQSIHVTSNQKPRIKKVTATTINWERIHLKFQSSLPPHLDWLCAELDIDKLTVSEMQVGWSDGHFAYTFPMRDNNRKIVGFRLRKRDGGKYAIRGSREGLFLPSLVKGPEQMIVIAEGPSDTMHLHSQAVVQFDTLLTTAGTTLL